MRNAFIESLFDDVYDVEQIREREWVVTTKKWSGLRDCYGNNVVDIETFWVKVSKEGRVSLGPVA